MELTILILMCSIAVLSWIVILKTKKHQFAYKLFAVSSWIGIGFFMLHNNGHQGIATLLLLNLMNMYYFYMVCSKLGNQK